MSRKNFREAAAIVEQYWDDWEMDITRKHPSIVLRAGARKKRITFPMSPSDTNWYKAFERDVCAATRELRGA